MWMRSSSSRSGTCGRLFAKFAPTFKLRARITLLPVCRSAMWSPNVAAEWRSWATPRTIPPVKSFAAVFGPNLKHAILARLREFDCAIWNPAAADRAPRVYGRHFARVAGGHRAAKSLAGSHHRLGSGGTLGGIVMHSIGTAIRAALAAAAVGGPVAHRRYQEMAEFAVFSPNLGTNWR